MITLNEATSIALERNDRFDTYQEYADAYVFYIDDGVISDGGGNRNCVIEKKNGSVLSWSMYFMNANRNIVEIGKPKKIEK